MIQESKTTEITMGTFVLRQGELLAKEIFAWLRVREENCHIYVISGVSGSACAAVSIDHFRTYTAILTWVGTAFVDFDKHIII